MGDILEELEFDGDHYTPPPVHNAPVEDSVDGSTGSALASPDDATEAQLGRIGHVLETILRRTDGKRLTFDQMRVEVNEEMGSSYKFDGEEWRSWFEEEAKDILEELGFSEEDDKPPPARNAPVEDESTSGNSSEDEFDSEESSDDEASDDEEDGFF